MEATNNRLYVSSEVRFYKVEDLVKMLGWSEKTVQKLFSDPKFPSADFGKTKVVEAHALIDYFSRKHSKEAELYWSKKGYINGRKNKLDSTSRRRVV